MLSNKLKLSSSIAYQNNGLFVTHLNSNAWLGNIPGKLSSTQLLRDIVCSIMWPCHINTPLSCGSSGREYRESCLLCSVSAQKWCMDAEIIFLLTLLDRNHIAPSCAQLRGLVSLCAEEGEVIRYGLAWKFYHTIQNRLWPGPLCIHWLSSDYPCYLTLLLH